MEENISYINFVSTSDRQLLDVYSETITGVVRTRLRQWHTLRS
jgi:hypothetical protein